MALVAMVAVVMVAAQQVGSPGGVGWLRSASGGDDGVVAFEDATRLRSAGLRGVQDNAPFREAEAAPWFDAWRRLEELGDPVHAAAASYTQLLNQPLVYRGVAVRVSGHALRVDRAPAGPNELGIKTLYRLTLAPEGGEVSPITVFCRERPAGVLVGAPVRVPAAASGYFFKNLSYRWRGGLGVTPVVMSNRVALDAPTHPPAEGPGRGAAAPPLPVDPWWVVGGAALLSAAMIGLVFAWAPGRLRRTARMRRGDPAAPLPSGPSP